MPIAAPDPAGAATIGAPINATARTGEEDESAVAVNPNNTQQIAVFTNGIAGDAGLPLSITSDGGATWTRTVFATGTGAGGDGRPLACCDPTLSWDDHGNLFVGYLQRTPRTIELFVTDDLGANFTNLGPVDTGGAGSLDQPTVVAGENSVWVTWRDDSGGISARGRSVTGALTFGAWGAEQDVSTVGNFGDIAIGPTGEVMVVYQNPTGNEGPSTMTVHTDADGLGAGGFGAGVNVGTTNVGGFDFLPAQPDRSVDAETGLAWDRSGGANDDRVYLVYTDETPAESNDFDIFVRTSDDDGANWSAPIQVNDDAGTNSQMLPKIALDQTSGDVGVAWYDARGDTGGGPSPTDIDGTANNDVTLFGSWSLDGGATWAANVAVADAPTDGYTTNGGQELGDYIGLAFHDGVMVPSWADNSNSTGDNPDGTQNTLDVYIALVQPRQDPPTVSVPDASGAEGSDIVLNGSASDPNGDPLTFAWVITSDPGNDPGADCFVMSGGGTLTLTIRCSDDGTYTATLTANGDPAGPVSDSATVTVSNVAPTLGPATVTTPIDEGGATTYSAGFTDPGWNDTYAGTIDWGFGPVEAVAPSVVDGGPDTGPDTGTLAGSHTYMDDGAFTVTGSVSDDDGGSSAAPAALAVNNVAPTALISDGGAVVINGVPTIITSAGDPVTFSATSTDPGSDDLALSWDFDDGPPSPDVTGVSLHAPPNPDPDPSPDGTARNVSDNQTHTFDDACFYDVTFASADDDGGAASDDIAVVVVGNHHITKPVVFWKLEFILHLEHSTADLQCLLDITGHVSQVFHEVKDASTPSKAQAILNKHLNLLSPKDMLDAQLLTAWLNFADGRVGYDQMVNTDLIPFPDTKFSDLMAQAEAVRLNPASTPAQLLAQKVRLEIFNLSLA